MEFNLRVEYKKVNRFILSLPDDIGIPKWVTKSSTRPKCVIENGSITWSEMSVSFWDPTSPSTTKKLWELLSTGINKKYDFKLELLDSTGEVVEAWGLNGCEITSIDFGLLDFNENTLVEPIMYFKPTNVFLIK